jgi:hypothetical protein
MPSASSEARYRSVRIYEVFALLTSNHLVLRRGSDC